MPPVRKIRLGLSRVEVEKRSHALDRFKIEVRDIVRLQPAMNGPALQRARLLAEVFHRQLARFRFFRIEQSRQPVSLIGGDDGCAPESGADFATKLFFDVRNDPAPHPVAKCAESPVRFIVTKLQSMRFDVGIDLGAPDVE